MKEKHADQGYRKLRDVWKDMTWQQRLDHFLYYYGVATMVAIFVIIMGVCVIVDVCSEKPQYLLEGMRINVQWSDDVENAVTKDLFEPLGVTDPERQKVFCNHFSLKQYSASMIENMYTRVYTKEIDYIITDQFAMDAIASWGFFNDLSILLSEETLKQWKPYLIYGEDEEENKIWPIAIDISKTEFAKKCKYEGDHLYIGFPGNTGREMTPEKIMEYIFSRFGGLTEKQPEQLLAGMTINVGWSDEAETAVTEDLFKQLGGTDPEKQKVICNHYELQNGQTSMIKAMYTKIYAGQVDYILTDKQVLDAVAPWNFYTDLNLVLSPETLEQWKQYIVYYEDDDEDETKIYPIAIDLSKTEFAKQCAYEGEHLYIGFTGNTDRKMSPAEFLEYLFSRFGGQ